MPSGLQVMSAAFNEAGLLQFSEAVMETKIA
jgi:Asp-tRNA(Asn)/Glu-tRNA(Gln) amidotransferase A subunit family amidase